MIFVALSVPAAARNITVADTIEMERFVIPSPYEENQTLTSRHFSPDGTRFVVVTQRGDLADNQLVATLWLFEVEAARAHLARRAGMPRPRSLALMRGRTANRDQNDDLAVIQDVRWSADGKQVWFRGRERIAEWGLYAVDVVSGALRRLTPPGQDVLRYVQRGDIVLYAVHAARRSTEPRDVVVATGRSLSSLLFPNEAILPGNDAALWTLRDGVAAPVLERESGEPVRVAYFGNTPDATLFELSENARYLAATRMRVSVPTSWEAYNPGFPTWRLRANNLDPAAEDATVGPEQIVLVDLVEGQIAPVLEAPLGRSVGWFNPAPTATWSRDGSRVTFVPTFLPLDGVEPSERVRRAERPVMISYDVRDRSWSEAAASKSANRKADHDKGAAPLAISVRQQLNVPPSLFVARRSSEKEAIEFFNPNPQLRSIALGEARPYNWRDPQGQEIKGVLLLPPDAAPGKRYPLVIEARCYSQENFLIDGTHRTAVAARAMAAVGLAVLQAAEPLRTDDPLYFRDSLPGALAGYESAIDQLAAEGYIDPERVGIIGFSRTTQNALYAATFAPKRFKAAVIADGFYYGMMQYFTGIGISANGSAASQYDQVYGGPPFGKDLTTYFERNPMLNLDRLTAAVRVEKHTRASLLGGWELYAGLRALHKPVDLILLPHASHVVAMPSDVHESQQGSVDWFRYWLKGEEDPDPAKASQYARWREFRKTRSVSTAR